MKTLLRTRVGNFDISGSLYLSEVEEYVRSGTIGGHIVSVDEIFSSYPKAVMNRKYDKLIYNGNSFFKKNLDFLSEQERTSDEGALVRVYDSGGVFVGIYRYDADLNKFIPYKMFL